MAEMDIKLKGWHAVVGIVLVIVVVVAKLTTLKDATDDAVLMRALKSDVQIRDRSAEVEKLKSAVKAHDDRAVAKTLKSMQTDKIKIESVQLSAPLLSFATDEKVIVKVVYSQKDSSGGDAAITEYYRFRRSAIGKAWRYVRKSDVVSYYLNFL